MRERVNIALWLLCLGFLSWFVPSLAQAYCFARTDAPRFGACQDSGSPRLHWTRGCAAYVFHELAFQRLPELSEQQVRDQTQAAFDTWRNAACEADPFSVQQLPGTTSGAPLDFVYDVPNEFVVSALTAAEWRAEMLDDNAIAMTQLWYNADTGEIYDVDVLLNLGQGDFGDCSAACASGTIDLQNTLTHEAGHVLGLGHTPVLGATMVTDARPGVTFMRSLETDDVLGLCALELPSHSCATGDSCECDTAPVVPSSQAVASAGCSLLTRTGPGQAGRGVTSGGWLLALAFMALCWRRVGGSTRGGRCTSSDE